MPGGPSPARSAASAGSGRSRPVTGSSWYAFSVTVSVTTRIAGSASSATIPAGSLAACRTPASDPITRVLPPVAALVVTLNRLSCAASVSTSSVLCGATPTMPQSPPAAPIAASV